MLIPNRGETAVRIAYRTLLIDVLGHPDFRAARITTNWLEGVLQ